jgi:ribosomal protein S27E
MHIIAKCPRCAHRWWLTAEAADRRVRCRKCHTLLRVPRLTELANATRIVTQATTELYADDTGKLFG